MAGIIQTTWAEILNKLGLEDERINTIDQQIGKTFTEKFGEKFTITYKSPPSAGSSNEVTIYEVTDNNSGNKKKVAVRLAKNPTFYTEREEGRFGTVKEKLGPNPGETPYYSITKKEQEDSQENWEIAHNTDLSPELYFYGYVKKYEDVDDLFLCIISEAYDGDLYNFYDKFIKTKSKEQIEIVNESIREQLTYLFDNMSTRLNMICFDIKPENTVVKVNDDGSITVKLIDWDADWCIKYDNLLKSRKLGGINAKNISLIMQMIMAYFFIDRFNNNIFASYFQQPEQQTHFEENYASMKHLFCSEGKHFHETAKHYFHLDDEKTCEETFDIIFKKTTGINVNPIAKRRSSKKFRRTSRKKSKRRKKN